MFRSLNYFTLWGFNVLFGSSSCFNSEFLMHLLCGFQVQFFIGFRWYRNEVLLLTVTWVELVFSLARNLTIRREIGDSEFFTMMMGWGKSIYHKISRMKNWSPSSTLGFYAKVVPSQNFLCEHSYPISTCILHVWQNVGERRVWIPHIGTSIRFSNEWTMNWFH